MPKKAKHQVRGKALPSWDAAISLIESAELLDEYARRHLLEAMGGSNRQLAPLRDPLTLNLGEHRWLAEDREESYSDWLAWILQGMKDASEILPLLGLDHRGTISSHHKVTREDVIDVGRTDILVRFRTEALVLVEVKVQPVGPELLLQLGKYAEWRARQRVGQSDRAGEPNMVLLGPEKLLDGLRLPDPVEAIKPFRFTGWQTVCRRLRRLADRVKGSDVMRAAAVLIFCGAVEQNLLGLSDRPARFRAMATVDYLRSWRTDYGQ